ncbi:unnamed protein product [Ceratitis capitata]|uniref:Phosphatidylinositol-glycan biosynthesis class W protein n=1 Tax=Ceratitis capitata TaxID=7213 RepID=A0A811UMY7_CERCA|nr:unnamed protein product [Ceratitis capitata]
MGLLGSYFGNVTVPQFLQRDPSPWTTILHAWSSLCLIMPIIFLIAVARLIGNRIGSGILGMHFIRYLTEGVIIIGPTLLMMVKYYEYGDYYTWICCTIMVIAAVAGLTKKPHKQLYLLGGHQPYVFKVNRAMIYILALVALLAQGFSSFPKYLQRTYGYGISLLDLDAGLYVFAMASISRTSSTHSHLLTNYWFYTPMAGLALARMALIKLVMMRGESEKRPSDDVLSNYFLAITVAIIIGCFMCDRIRHYRRQVWAGMAILTLHEIVLQVFTSEYALDNKTERGNIFAANKEAFLSIPGFLALFLLSIAFGNFLRSRKRGVPYVVFLQRAKSIVETCLFSWAVTLYAIFTTSIAPITCNFGYVAWVFAIGLSITLVNMFVFNFITNTRKYTDDLLHPTNEVLPSFVSSINKNGIICYVFACILKFWVDAMLEPRWRSENETFYILSLAMLSVAILSYLLTHLTLFYN